MYMREIELQEALAEGKTRTQIMEEFSERWDISPRSVENMYYKLVKQMEDLVIEGRAELRAKLMARNELIFQRALKQGQHKTALDANAAQAKLGGLFAEKENKKQDNKKIIITERDTPPVQLVGDKAENE